jgi:hypothetical protein
MEGSSARASSRRVARRVTRTIFKLVAQSPTLTARLLREPLIKAELERATRAETVDTDDPVTRVLLDTGLLRCQEHGFVEAEAPPLAETMREARLAECASEALGFSSKTYHPRAFALADARGEYGLTPTRHVAELDSPGYSPTSPAYEPTSPSYAGTDTPGYNPTSPAYAPNAPAYEPNMPGCLPDTPGYNPTSPVYAPSAPAYEALIAG